MESENSRMNTSQPAASGFTSLMRMLRILFFCFLTLIIGVFVYYFIFSGIFRVDEQYKAMLMRFGVLQYRVGDEGRSPILQSGKWYWSYPYPVDQVIMVPANKSVSVSTAETFKPWINPTGGEMGSGIRPMQTGVDGYVVSGDMHIFHVEWVVSFRVEDAAQYYLNFYDDTDTLLAEPGAKNHIRKRGERLRGHEIIIRNLLADAVLTETANWTTEELIKVSRTVQHEGQPGHEQRIEDCVRSRLDKLVREIALGIEIQTVTLVGMYQPPAAALQAFNQVNASERNKQIAIQNAQAFANSLLIQARATSERIIGEANAYQETIVHRLKAEAEYFTAIQKEYRENPTSTATVLYTEAIGRLLASVPNKYVLHQLPDNLKQELRLQISQVPEKRREQVAAPEEPEGMGASAQPGAGQGAQQ